MATLTVSPRDHTAVSPVDTLGRFAVASATRPGETHPVLIHPNGLMTCGCESGNRGRACWHRSAVVDFLLNLTGAAEIVGLRLPSVPANLRAVAYDGPADPFEGLV